MFGNVILETLKSSKKADQVDERILNAFRYFDQQNLEYIHADDLEAIIHSLGKDLSCHFVHSLVSKVCEENSKKVIYSNLSNKVIFE
jgi:Ca2+-binding EF-hand superfamily protein